MMTYRNRIAVVILVALAAFVRPTTMAADFMVPSGTEIQVVFEQDVSSKYVEPGDLVPIRLSQAIDIGGTVVIDEGAKGSARVKSVKPAGRGGKPGRVEIELLELTAGSGFESVGNKNITIAGKDGSIIAEGKGKKTLSWLFIFGLFIKGGQGVIGADQPMTAVVADDIIVVVP
ncbi:MAG: hypothetical protein ABIE70_02430 [bacterium]